jgi:hypothetical protein
MTDMTAGAPRIDLGRVVNRTFGTMGRNFLLFFLLTLVLYAVPSYGVQFLMTVYGPQAVDDPGTYLLASFVVSIVASLPAYVAVGAVTHGAIISFNGGKAELGDCLSTGIGRMLPLFLLGLVTSLAITFASLLLIVPGIIVAVMVVVAVPAMVVERLGVFGSMSRSADLTKGNRWTIFFLGLICIVIVIAILFGVGVLVGGLGGAGEAVDSAFLMQGSLFMIVFVVLANVLSMIISSTGIASLYYELRTSKEGATSAELAKVFD